MTTTLPFRPRLFAFALVLAAAVAAGLFGVYRYVDNYWLYRGFAPPRDPAYVRVTGSEAQLYVTSAALGGRRQLVDVYLPPGYSTHPNARYPVLYLLHGVPGRPGAFLATVRMGVLDDELVALHKIKPLILVMPDGSTSSFTDKEWVNGIKPHEGWETFVARDVVHAIDTTYRTIPGDRALAGLSEGGYGALNIGLHHPGEFRILESWSGYERADPLRAIFGKSQSRLIANSPLHSIQRVAARLRRDHTYIWFYSGTTDWFQKQNAQFARLLNGLKLPHDYFIVRGGHNWALWRGNAARAMLAAARRLDAA
ncbi:MAG TPA: alpha/beta hydrolase-fold protein [Gaiellaceae bacterium]|nr:alpha/beta hydrolase-fold protein [Gaiellaceae bacterium]